MVFGYKSSTSQLKRQLQKASHWFQTAQFEKAARAKQQSIEIAMYLAVADDPTNEERARIKAEALIRDFNTAEAYEILQLHCELLSEGIHLMSTCPPDLVSYAVTLIWASSIIDLNGLRQTRKFFRHMYGEEFETDALKNAGGVVNERVVSKFSAFPPSTSFVNTYLKKIADDHGVDWNPPLYNIKPKARKTFSTSSTISATTSSTKSCGSLSVRFAENDTFM